MTQNLSTFDNNTRFFWCFLLEHGVRQQISRQLNCLHDCDILTKMVSQICFAVMCITIFLSDWCDQMIQAMLVHFFKVAINLKNCRIALFIYCTGGKKVIFWTECELWAIERANGNKICFTTQTVEKVWFSVLRKVLC